MVPPQLMRLPHLASLNLSKNQIKVGKAKQTLNQEFWGFWSHTR